VLYREVHVLLDELAEAIANGSRKDYMQSVATVPLLIVDDFGMRKLPHTAAEDLLEIVMRRYERFSTLLTSNRPVEDWGKLLGDVAAVGAMLDRLLHHGHVLKCGPRSWRTKAPDRIIKGNGLLCCEDAALALPGFIALGQNVQFTALSGIGPFEIACRIDASRAHSYRQRLSTTGSDDDD
jgi:hypothetical protein